MRYMLLGVTAVLAANAAQAATVGIETGLTFASRANEGLFSSYAATPSIYTERLNSASQIQNCGIQHSSVVSVSNLGTGDAGFASGRFINRALPPGTNSASIAAGRVDTDQSCYLSTPNPLSPANQTATINPVKLSVTLPKQNILYLGWYWGSIDSYNYLTFFDKLGNTINFSNVPGSFGTGRVTGQDVINLFGLGSAESRFIDFSFTAADNFGYVLLGSGNTGFELDNLSYGTSNPIPSLRAATQHTVGQRTLVVSEPTLVGILGLGIACLMARRTRRGARA